MRKHPETHIIDGSSGLQVRLRGRSMKTGPAYAFVTVYHKGVERLGGSQLQDTIIDFARYEQCDCLTCRQRLGMEARRLRRILRARGAA